MVMSFCVTWEINTQYFLKILMISLYIVSESLTLHDVVCTLKYNASAQGLEL